MIEVSWLAVRGCERRDVESCLSSYSDQPPSPRSVREITVLEAKRWVNVALEAELFSVHDWCQLLTQLFDSVAIGFVAFEGLWDYSVFRSGLEVAGMDARSEARTFLYGDLASATEILGVDVGVLKSYCRSYPIPERWQAYYADLFDSDWGEGVRAQPGDEVDPWNEWAHCDFARHVGAEYPVGRGEEVLLPVASRCETWMDLPRRLNRHATRVYPSRLLGLERLHPRNWG